MASQAGLASAEERSDYIIPPGREEAIQDWLEPLQDQGFAGMRSAGVSIHREEIRIALDGGDGPTVESCRSPQWAKKSAGIVLRRGATRETVRVTGSAHQGTVEHDWLQLTWFICKRGRTEVQRAPAEARRLADMLAIQNPDSIWEAPRSVHDRQWPKWPLLIGIALVLAALGLRKRRSIAIVALTAAAVPIAAGLVAAWEERYIALLWLALLPPIVVAILLTVRRGPAAMAELGIPIVASGILRALAEHGPANWYVDLTAGLGAVQAPYTRFEGGWSTWTSLASSVVSISPAHVFALSVVTSSLAIGLLVSALGRAIGRDSVWPKGSQYLWGVLLTLDAALIWLGASDAPHNIALLAFSVVFWWTVEASGRESSKVVVLLTIGLCASLVGLTRPELLLAPATCALLMGLGGKKARLRRFVEPALAAFVGVAVAGSLWLMRGGLSNIDHALRLGWAVRFLEWIGHQAPWNVELEPFLVGVVPIVVVIVFLVACWKRRYLALVFAAYVVIVLPKIVAGFGSATIGPIDPSQRYNIVLIPIVLLMTAGGAASVGKPMISWIRGEVGTARRVVATVGAVVIAAWIVFGVVTILQQPARQSFRADYRFLVENLDQLPPGSTVVTVWLEHLSERDLDAQLAVPHALIGLARPHVRWVVLGPDDDISVQEGEYFYRGSTCSLVGRGGLRFGDETADDRRLVSEALARCSDLELAVEQWIAETDEQVSPGTWTMRDGRVRLGLGRLGSR